MENKITKEDLFLEAINSAKRRKELLLYLVDKQKEDKAYMNMLSKYREQENCSHIEFAMTVFSLHQKTLDIFSSRDLCIMQGILREYIVDCDKIN